MYSVWIALGVSRTLAVIVYILLVYVVFNGFLRFWLCLVPASEPQSRKKP